MIMSTIFCWGNGQDGQLGIRVQDDKVVSQPSQLTIGDGKEVVDVACGGKHTLITTEGGMLYTCGNNDQGQLGHDKPSRRLEVLDGLKAQHVKKTRAGDSHSLALTAAHEVFSWGDNSSGQLGRGQPDDETRRIPKLVKQLAVHSVLQVCCGSNHCVVLTCEGLVATWGANNFGQLGLGTKQGLKDTPEFINCLKGIPIAQIDVGGNHSIVLSKSGAVYGWGRNSFGQLGVNDEKDKPFPTLCRSLRHQRIKHIACGEDHSTALTQDGGVFTFGAGSYGQLGHTTNNNEILPKQVMELMGSEVTQTACGRRHTLAYVPSSGQLYAFGLGGSGQLGTGSTESKSTPCLVIGPFMPVPRASGSYMHVDGDEKLSVIIQKIFAGGDHSFVVSVDAKVGGKVDDYREKDTETQILMLTSSRVQLISQLRVDELPPIELDDEVTKIFSHAACINGSFLLLNDRHSGCSRQNHGIDMDSVRENFQKFSQTTNIVIIQRIASSIEQDLLPGLPSSPPDVEALRLFLILPECHLFDQPKYYSSIICPFGRCILNLSEVASKVLEAWWSTLKTSFFLRVVDIYRQCIDYILQMPDTTNPQESEKRGQGLFVSLEILKKLNIVNEQSGQIVEYHKFYISELKNRVNIKKDYVSWVQQNGLRQKGLHFCNYPFLFDAAAKSMLLQTDAMMQMQTAIDEVHRRNFTSLFLPIDPVNPCLLLFVTRTNLVRDTLEQLSKHSSADLKKPLKIVFVGEEAIDGGGLKKEFFLLLLREVLDPKYGMFKYDEESHLQWFNSQTFEDKSMFHLIGVLCGLAIYNFTIIDLQFPQALYKKLLNRKVTLDDLKELLPSVGRSLQHVLDYEGDDIEAVLGITFEISVDVFGELKTRELCPDGAKKAVTKENKREYVDLYIDYVFNKAAETQYDAFSSGFLKVCGGRVLELFHPQELQAMVVGNENYDFIELEKNTEYKGEYHRYHQTIQFFWEVFHEMSMDDKKKFLVFLTGSDRIPIFGMQYVKIVIQPTGGGDDFLPVAHTCFNLLDLPKYSSKTILRDKLVLAIQQTEGFGLV
ncbi:probable E3 ubiquitin-protein ligase HERC4 [Gigantopelta aegis]|uniref:probable E3 ubiquitin-protein ligase HERC4 n=1 Tax=Gigantopelta aegis TaxID=1735272 RepID=UPI001B88960B|nr:probable E3 ubiquitin-protein ligase HERC4 [Gigantopelta aegis]